MNARRFPVYVVFGLCLCLVAADVRAADVRDEDVVRLMPMFNVRSRERLVQRSDLKPQRFRTASGGHGWRMRIAQPGALLAPPAVVDNVVYIGGGFDSRRFWALDAETGDTLWTYVTVSRDPGIPVVSGGRVAYIAEGTRLYVREAKGGRFAWGRQFRGTLTTHVAAADGRLFLGYPYQDDHYLAAFNLSDGAVLWNQSIPAAVITTPVVHDGAVYIATVDGMLTRFDAKTGKEQWAEQHNATTAPRIVAGNVFIGQRYTRKSEVSLGPKRTASVVACQWTMEGVNLVDAETGKLLLDEPVARVHAPYLQNAADCQRDAMANKAAARNALFVFRAQEGKHALGALARYKGTENWQRNFVRDELRRFLKRKRYTSMDSAAEDARKAAGIAAAIRGLLKSHRGRPDELAGVARKLRATAKLTRDAIVAARNLKPLLNAVDRETGHGLPPRISASNVAALHIGRSNARAVWAYQGSRPLVIGGQFVISNGCLLRAFDWPKGTPKWALRIPSKLRATRPISPPAIAGRNLYVATADGKVVCIDAVSGKVRWEEQVGKGIFGEPIVAAGRIYLAARTGHLVCLETGDKSADGWPMWGGGAGHNGGPVAWPPSGPAEQTVQAGGPAPGVRGAARRTGALAKDLRAAIKRPR